MPRGRPSTSKKSKDGPQPSHPAETYREHRKFLIRSLERNDVDMNALIELNKSIHKAKEKVLQSCGELTLLDLGSGRLQLINDELQEKETETTGSETTGNQHLTSTQKEICIDFLLRMKLRVKLSTRLIRRLTRLAHAMDGKDVTPPVLPRYGDLRLHIDPKSIESRRTEWKEREDAKNRIEKAIAIDLLNSGSTGGGIKSEEKESETGTEERKSNCESNDTEMGTEDDVKEFPDKTKSIESPIKDNVDCSSSTGEDNAADGDKQDQSKSRKSYYTLPALKDGFKLLQEYENIYDKEWDDSTKTLNYVLAKEKGDVPDYEELTNGGGIGATAMFTSLDDLEAEHKRWSTTVLRKIQQQPTFDELGLENRVFNLKDRRKRCLKDIAEEGEAELNTDGGSPKKKKLENQNHKNNDDSESDEDEKMEKEDVNIEDLKPKRSVSFLPIPSFHDQDFARIRLIHRDLLNSSQAELTRKRYNDATNEYNKALQLSTQLFDARQMVQHNLTFTIAKGRQELTKAHSDYTIAYTTAKQLWLKEKYAYDMKKSRAVLPTKWGSQPIGTEIIKKYLHNSRLNVQAATICQTLADVVDGSIMIAEGKAPFQRFKDFVPPPAPGMNAQTGENMAQRQHRIEMEYRKQYNVIDAKFQKSEGDRGRAWRKVMKAQADINSVSGNTRGARVTLSNYQTIPVPVIRSSAQQSLSSQYIQQSAKLTPYTAPIFTPTRTPVDMSKYSIAKVNQRKSADGTVAPVSEPKKDKDGLYLRPAGRTRKGMQWDAVNGVWVPER